MRIIFERVSGVGKKTVFLYSQTLFFNTETALVHIINDILIVKIKAHSFHLKSKFFMNRLPYNCLFRITLFVNGNTNKHIIPI